MLWSLRTSDPLDSKSAMFLCKIFFSSSTESSWTKRWSVLNEKRCRVKCFHKNSCFSCLYWKYLQKRTPNRNLVGTKLNVFFWIISFSAYLLPIDAHISSTSISATSISKKKKKKEKKRHILTSSSDGAWSKQRTVVFVQLAQAREGVQGGIRMEDGERQISLFLSMNVKRAEKQNFLL